MTNSDQTSAQAGKDSKLWPGAGLFGSVAVSAAGPLMPISLAFPVTLPRPLARTAMFLRH
jgi:hypothetical protein